MAGMTPLPPYVVHSSTRLTHGEAHSLLGTFLATAENDAAYRPDSTLTERGPQSTSTGANPNLTLHHLKRILHGIEGKKVGGENAERLFGDLAPARPERSRKRNVEAVVGFTSSPPVPDNAKRQRKATVGTGPDEEGPSVVGEEADGWQDKEQYEIAQDEGGLELLQDEMHPGGTDQPKDDMEATQEMDLEPTAVDKEERKKAKAARKKDEKRKKEAAKAKR